MDGNDNALEYRELIGKIRRLCAEGRTGTVFITTSDNHAARFGLRGGAITSAMFRQQTGLAALESIKGITAGRLTYSTDVVEHAPHPELPPTRELLALLDGGAGKAETARADEDGAVVAPTGVAGTITRNRAVIESELAEYLGPMARLVVDEHVARATQGRLTSVNDAIESLAKELGDAAKAARFKERLRGRLAADTEARR